MNNAIFEPNLAGYAALLGISNDSVKIGRPIRRLIAIWAGIATWGLASTGLLQATETRMSALKERDAGCN
ncbi:hypothetical protein MKX07_005698 [Trichoderma sp. CBMAI-0711]|nr:hypothetical protein MKX07_005698 [Trichoderma sp. CBMAI-0711]